MGLLYLLKGRAAPWRNRAYLPGRDFFFVLLAVASIALSPVRAASAGAEATGSAAEPMAESVPTALNELVREAVENNPRVTAARLMWESVKEKYPQATSYDDPMLMYTQPIRGMGGRVEAQESAISLSQMIPFPGKLGLKGEIVTKEIEIAKTGYEKAVRSLTAEVKKAYYELYYIDRAVELARENDAVLDYFAEVSRANYGLSVSQLDELVRAQMLSAEASLDLIRLDDMRTGVVARLNTLLYRPEDTTVSRVEEPELKLFTYSLDELKGWAVENYEELRIAGLSVEKSELETRLAGYSYLPNFNIGVNYSQMGDPLSQGQDAYAVTFGVNIPIWYSRNRAEVSEASINREKSFVEKNAVANELENELKTVYSNLTNSFRIVKLYGETLVPEAEESLGFAEARYKNGEEMLGRLLETQSLWLNFRLVYLRSFSDYLKSIAELERLSGRELY